MHQFIPIIKITVEVFQCPRIIIMIEVIQISQVVNLKLENRQNNCHLSGTVEVIS